MSNKSGGALSFVDVEFQCPTFPVSIIVVKTNYAQEHANNIMLFPSNQKLKLPY
jgi:hypothetical protein